MKNLIFTIVLLVSCSSMQNSKEQIPDYVPNQETAIRIAEAIWLPIYGEKVLMKKPFHAKLQGDVWIVEGSLKEGERGGVPRIEINKKNCKILKVSHGK